MRDENLSFADESSRVITASVLPLACPACGARYEAGTRFCAHDGSALPELAADSLAGLIIADRYRLGRKLGAGGVGEVYLAEHLRIGRPCALKLLKADLRKEPEAVGRFVREATNASRINHPHVCQIYDFGEAEGGLVYLTMEYVRGEPLSQLLIRDGPLDARRVAVIIKQVASGLDAAHALGIVHRDLKPENVILRASTADDGLDDVKIVDFGLAKVFGDRAQQVTDTGCFVGTPHYMAPEQLVPATVDWRCDVYALGLLAFVLLTGRLPVDGESALEVMRLRLSEPPLSLATVVPNVRWPVELEEVFAHVLARKPGDRYQSAGAFASDLDTVIAAWTTPPVVHSTVSAVDLPTTKPRAPRLRRAPRWRVSGTLVRRIALGAAVVAIGGVLGLLAARLVSSGDTVTVAPAAPTMTAAAGTIAQPVTTQPVTTQPVTTQPVTTQSRTQPTTQTVRARPSVTDQGAPIHHMPAAESPQAVLKRLDNWTDPRNVDQLTAERALDEIQQLLPQLTTRSDSVEALYRAAEANVALGNTDAACETLTSLRERAAGTAFSRAVASLADSGLRCR
ncbi:MAG TPA: protein kinase [Gemmatimonadaceae bacterium]|jgi:serine/threonine protein kinase|nr:protein kinase [Gemmatimonadaceae bacterium]